MLSTSDGYRRPAFLAERFALALRAGDSFFDFLPTRLRGLAFFQGGFREDFAMSAPNERGANARP
jgi:hypothetical protein